MSLISSFEFTKYSLAKRAYPIDTFNVVKDSIEYKFFEEFLGTEFYTILKADQIPWNTITEWVAGTYLLNAKVFWQGCVFESKENSNTEEPSLTSTKWQEAKRFTTPEYNTLWKTYLRSIISNTILKTTMVFETFPIEARGVNIYTESEKGGQTGATNKEMDQVRREIQNYLDAIIKQMVEYIETTNKTNATAYAKVYFIVNNISTESTNKNTGRQIHLMW